MTGVIPESRPSHAQSKHTVFYDRLPHYFLKIDVLDRDTGAFLSRTSRRMVLAGLPIMPVPVVYGGEISSVRQLNTLTRPTPYKSANWRNALNAAAECSGNLFEMVEQQTEDSDLAEGLYLKYEGAEYVLDRYKFVRADFHQAMAATDGHWRDRPILPNALADGIDIFSPVLGVEGAYDAKPASNRQ